MAKLRGVLIALNGLALVVLVVSALWVMNERWAVSAAVRLPNLRFDLMEDHVTVRLDGQEIQSIPFDPAALTRENRAYFIATPDINFDGYPDLTLIRSQGLQNIYYDGWLWVPAEQRFVRDPAIEGLSSPVFDEKDKRIRTYEHGSATDHVSAEYAYLDGTLTEIWRQEQSYDVERNLFTLRTYRLKDGRLMLTDEERLTPEQLEARDD